MKLSIREATDRFVQIAFVENPNIKDLSDFKDALMKAFNTERGGHATGQFNDEEFLHFFNSRECRELIRQNVDEKEYNRLYGEVKRGEVYVERAKPKGVPIKAGQVAIIHIEKKISIKTHTRAGLKIRAYSKGYKKWTNSEIRFLQVRKVKKLSVKQIQYQYNQHYQEAERSPSSIKSKVYRI
jgi:hypothetical protein